MAYSCSAVEHAMKVQEVILRAIDGKLTWVQAADEPDHPHEHLGGRWLAGV